MTPSTIDFDIMCVCVCVCIAQTSDAVQTPEP